MMDQLENTSQGLRRARTRCFIQAGGLLQKSGLMDVFLIAPGDNLQDNHNLEKAAQLLGFLTECFQKNDFDKVNLEQWRAIGERMLRSSKSM